MSKQARSRASRSGPAAAGPERSSRAGTPPTSGKPPSGGLTGFLGAPPAWAAALGFALLHLLLGLWVFDPTVFSGGDNAAYRSLARSLVERHEYRSLWLPGAPPHTQYPPVFPGIIALERLLGLDSWVAIKLAVLLLSAVAVAFTYLWLRRRGRPGLGIAVATIVAVSPGVLAQSHLELSDVPFWAFTMVALWAFERLGERDRWPLAVAVVATVLAYFTRTAGLPLLVAALAWLAWKRRWKQLAVVAGVVLPLAFLWWLRAHLTGGMNYARIFWYRDPYSPALGTIGPADLVHRVFANAGSYLSVHLPWLLAEQATPILVLISYATALLALFGWISRVRRPQVADLFFPLYVGLIFVWPEVWAGERFLLPVFPLVLAYAGFALAWLLQRWSPRATMPVAGAVVALIVVLGIPNLTRDAVGAGECRAAVAAGQPEACLGGAWQEYFDMARWAKDGLPEGAAVFSRKPEFFYVYSGHPSVTIPMVANANVFFSEARRNGIGYVALDQLGGLTSRYVLPVVETYPQAFCVVHIQDERTGVAILRIRDLSPGAPASPTTGSVSVQQCAGAQASSSSSSSSPPATR